MKSIGLGSISVKCLMLIDREESLEEVESSER